MVRWEGTECYNYSPLVYAHGKDDLAITGSGTLDGQSEGAWATWKKKQKPDKIVLRQAGNDLTPVEERTFGPGHFLRPSMIQFMNCKNILVEGVTIIDAPFWVIHPTYCRNVTVRKVTVDSWNTNNDGCDPESCKDVLIEDCTFNCGDDSIALKAGRDQDAWRVGLPCENVVIRNCELNSKCNGMCIGSEMSGGVRNVFVENCKLGKADSALYFKCNLDRGGYIENVWIRNITARNIGHLVRFRTDYHGHRGGNFPTIFRNFLIENVECETAHKYGVRLGGVETAPIKNVFLRNVNIKEAKTDVEIRCSQNVVFENVTINGKAQPLHPAKASTKQALTGIHSAAESGLAHMANGIKIGEATSTSAIIWTRLTKAPEGNFDGKPFPNTKEQKGKSSGSRGRSVEDKIKIKDLSVMEGSVIGTPGDVRLTYWPADQTSSKRSMEWQAVDMNRDFIHQFEIKDLLPGTRYTLLAEGRPKGGTDASCKVDGTFVTAPSADTPARIRFAVVTGQDYPRRDTPQGHRIYPLMQMQNLDFFVHTGDIEYYDRSRPYADTLELARFKWNRIYALPLLRSFHNNTASYFMKDDHDTLKDDCWPKQTYGDLTWEQGLAVFREQVPMGKKTYRTIRWGKDLQIWLVEGRDFRSPNNIPDGPAKTIWGLKQKQWFFNTVKESNATFRILISPTPLVGPDRDTKNDNHANKGFSHEGDELRGFIGKQKNMLVVCGDRHWQYVSEDPKTRVREYSCGPTSNVHAGGFRESDRSPMHKYLKVKGGFLTVVIERDKDDVRAIFTHYGAEGSVYNKDIVKAD